MSFTKRHYDEVARIIREHRTYLARPTTEASAEAILALVQEDLRRMFAADNPRFDPARFDLACEPKAERTER